jgi:hypothetical protein
VAEGDGWLNGIPPHWNSILHTRQTPALGTIPNRQRNDCFKKFEEQRSFGATRVYCCRDAVSAGLRTSPTVSANPRKRQSWRSVSEHPVRDRKIAGSNPVAPTNLLSLGACAAEGGTIIQLARLPQERRSVLEEGSRYLRNRAESVLPRTLLACTKPALAQFKSRPISVRGPASVRPAGALASCPIPARSAAR